MFLEGEFVMATGFSTLPDSLDQSTSPGGAKTGRNLLGRKKDSEWVFRPLKLKFKVKELEQLYNNAVYRQRQGLLLGACILMVMVSIIIFLVYLGRRKVWY